MTIDSTTTAPVSATVDSTTTVTASTTTAPASPTTTAPVPTLGRMAGVFATNGVGFGTVRPPHIYNGGDPTGDVSNISWSSWGGPHAIGSGTGDYVAPGQIVADGIKEQATVVAFQLGVCGGQLMYQAVEWYFPQHGQQFDSSHYEDICSGSYYPPSP